MEYKVGDIVLVKAKVLSVDDDGELDLCVMVEEDVVALLDRKPEKPAEPEFKYKVGDKVIHIHKPEWGVGTVGSVIRDHHSSDYFGEETDKILIDGDTNPYLVNFSHYNAWLCCERNLTPA